jgi:hypothetical protein
MLAPQVLLLMANWSVGKTALAQTAMQYCINSGHSAEQNAWQNDLIFVPLGSIATQTTKTSACTAVASAVVQACKQPVQAERDVVAQLIAWLQIRAEYLVQLTGLPVLSTSAQSFTGESASQINTPYPTPYPAALQLFINRAQRLSSHPMDDEATLFQITQICNLVDVCHLMCLCRVALDVYVCKSQPF